MTIHRSGDAAAALASTLGLRLDDISHANVAKLRARYPDGFVPGGGKR